MPNDATMIDGFLSTISGLDNVGYDQVAGMDDAEVGARVKRMKRAEAAGQQAAPRHARSERSVQRRSSGGFPLFVLLGVVGNSATQTLKVSRVVDIDMLYFEPTVVPSNVVIDSIKVGDEEQLLTPGVPLAMYGAAALASRKPDNFSPLGSGQDLTVTLRNTSNVAVNVTAGIKGDIDR